MGDNIFCKLQDIFSKCCSSHTIIYSVITVGKHIWYTWFGWVISDRPFNLQGGLWFFVSFRIFVSDNTSYNIYFFCRAKREIFLQVMI